MHVDRHARMASLGTLGAIAAMLAGTASAASAAVLPPPGFKVAFIGDGNDGSGARAVLELIVREGADAVVHAGDLDYSDPAQPDAWDGLITQYLGPCFPYFVVMGNHDVEAYDHDPDDNGTYLQVLTDRMNCAGIPWTDELGKKCSFSYQGVFFVMTSPDVFVNNDGDAVHAPYIRNRLAADTSAWRISTWHKNQTAMQMGSKQNEAGWGVYEESRRGGAIVATGHEHSYSRTHAMSNFELQTVASTSNTIVLKRDKPETDGVDEGRSFAFVSGLGGRSGLDPQFRCPPTVPPYGCNGEWASVYTTSQGSMYGALFGEFNYNGDPCLAHFYFMNIQDDVKDEFFVRSRLGPCVPCHADLNGSGTVDLADVTAVMSGWGGCGGGCPEDLDGDGTVGEGDLTMVVNSQGLCGTAPALRKIVLQRP